MSTTQVKDSAAIERLKARIEKSAQSKKVDNSSLPAGSPMYFYCRLCGVLCDTKPESYLTAPKKYCDDCYDLKETSGLTDLTLRELATGKS